MNFDHTYSPRRRQSRDWGEEVEREHAFQRAILAIPEGKVSTYGKVAAAAGYPGYHRQVARFLSSEIAERLPWHRVIGADGAIKTNGKAAREQRERLHQEGVSFSGERVDLKVALFDSGDAY